MGHLLKIKCVDSKVNVRILASTGVPFTLTTRDGASAKFSTNSHETDNSVGYVIDSLIVPELAIMTSYYDVCVIRN